MGKKGYTLVEVILAITLIGMIAVAFLPTVTFGYTNILKSTKFMETAYKDQEAVERKINELSNTEATGGNKINIYGQMIEGHDIHIATTNSGEVNVFLPTRIIKHNIPVLEYAPVLDIRDNGVKVVPQPKKINLMDKDKELYTEEVPVTWETRDYFLLSAYRWYVSAEMSKDSVPSQNTKDYYLVKEWNEAKKQLKYADSEKLKFTPNIKDSYNIMKFQDAKEGMSMDDESYINNFGNRYLMYGVTPFSDVGRIGKERFSNHIYIEAPRINIIKAEFIKSDEESNKVHIYFEDEISDEIHIENISMDEEIGAPTGAYRNIENHKILVLEFGNDVTDLGEIGGNILYKGAVGSKKYGGITIWNGEEIEGEFVVTQGSS